MHNNYYYIRQLSAQLKTKLTGWTLETCFSQEKDELVIGFSNQHEEFYIKAILTSYFACLVFPGEFHRARKNSVELFEQVLHKAVIDVIQYQNERSFGLVLEQDYLLLFKMHGNRSNIILFHQNTAIDLFHQKLVNDFNLRPESLHRSLDQSFENFERNNYQLQALYPTFGKLVGQYILTEAYQKATPVEKWQKIQLVVSQLERPYFYITLVNKMPALALLPVGEIVQTTADAIEAANLFYNLYARLHGLEKEKTDAVRALEKRKNQTENYLAKAYDKLATIEEASKNEHIANIIMANLHQIPARSESVELFDFYQNQPIRIKLKKEFSPQKNAEVYYRKSKNEGIEINKLQEIIEKRELELQQIEKQIASIQALTQVKELRKYLKDNLISQEKTPASPDELFKKTEYMGFEIWIGKNAKNNDLLTQKYAHKEDLWLHAKDVSGSHVIIKHQDGKNFPEPVIERAAGLAAFFSKMRTDSVCPVIVTPKKYVRKPKGLPEGAVVIDREKVIMIEPLPWKEVE